MSQQAVSLVETGQCRRLSLACVERILAGLEAEIELVVRWRGGEIDRVTDAAHAALLGGLAELLSAMGWLVKVEVTYSIERDRGSVDLMAFESRSSTTLVAEIKGEVTSADSTLRRHDEKIRLGEKIGVQRFGWIAQDVAGLLVLPDSSTARRRVRGLGRLFDEAYPLRSHALRRWLLHPDGPVRGLLFLSATKHIGDRRLLTSRRRVQAPGERVDERSRRSTAVSTAGRFIDSSGEHQHGW